ncbi:ABC transporter ATP-binding protein [Bacillaceae bacterium SIJ1]|uniref:ABC transporter ATP-binding protein n=1 Tax=Litoribacterium kuwaitense TaxID=1398745 RepID=UPI0013EBDB60|nr:ABC transporter ATP-binding protein [Litoribacterium kuwaitense]NGP46470.1 ABC transporter ATP-binding protein [Litoribacterium kuwaitense]
MLEIKNLTKMYGQQKKAVDNLSLTIKAGDIFGFIGGNGAGKTSTIKAVVGIHQIDHGDILIDGHSMKKQPLVCKKMMAYIPDHPDLYEHLTGYQYINFIADLYNIPTAERVEKTRKYSELFEMTANLGNIISTYSHGMKQRTNIIAAMVHSPKLLILDEPFVGLDPKAVFSLKQVMQDCVSNGGAIFFSTHVLDVAEKLCNKIAIIKQGKLVASGLTEHVKGAHSLEAFFMEVQDA